jgi:hypothetical protein
MNEELLRMALHEVGDVPPPKDLAGAALVRARRDGRRRVAGLVTAVVVLVAAAILVPAVALHRSPAPTAGPPGNRYLVNGYRVFSEGGPAVDRPVAFWDPARSAYASVPESLFVFPSPDATWAAVVKDTDIHHVGVARTADLGRIGARAVSWLPGAGRYVAWSPDGDRLLTQVGDSNSARLALVEVPSRTVRPVTLHGAGALFDRYVTLRWQPDGRGFLAVQAWRQPGTEPTGPSALWSFGPDGTATGSRPMPRADDFALSPDGRRVLITNQYTPVEAATIELPRNMIYDFRSGRSTRVPDPSYYWYDDDHVLTVSYDHGDTVVEIVAVEGGRVVVTRTVEDDPAVRYGSVELTPLTGPAPPGAIVL